MTPIGSIFLGLLIALLDMRLPGFDVLADPLGWILVLIGLSRLMTLDARFGRVRVAAVGTGLLSFADVVHPTVARTAGTAGTTAATVAPDGVHGLLVVAYGLAVAVTAVLLSLALRDRAREHGDTGRGRIFSAFSLLHAALGVAVLVTAVLAGDAGTRVTGTEAAIVAAVAAAGLAVHGCFLWALATSRELPWLQREPSDPDPAPLTT